MNKKYYPYIIVTLTSLLLSLLYCPPYNLYSDDKEIFKLTGFLIKKGAVPYKDFFDHKPPLIFFYNYLGAIVGSWGLWLLDAALVLYASLQFLKLNIRHKIVWPVVLPILFNLILRNHYSYGIGMTREYTTIFLLLAFCLVMGSARFKYFWLGLLAALIFFMQQDQTIILAPFVIYLLFTNNEPLGPLKKIAHLLLGGLAILLPIVMYFILHDGLKEFWEAAFLFNFKWYTSPDAKPGMVQELIALKGAMYLLNFEIVMMGTLFLIGASFFVGNAKKWLLVAATASIALSFISELLSGNLATKLAYCYYYFLPLAATLPFALFLVFAFTKNEVFNHKIHQFIYASLLFLNPVMSIAEHRANFYRYPQNLVEGTGELLHLDKTPLSDYQLYVFNNSNYIYSYNKYQIKPPSKWLYHYFWNWYQQWDKDNLIIESIIMDLRRHRTQYVIDFSTPKHFLQKSNYTTWIRFRDSAYTQLKPLHLWQLKQ